ncbi:MAG: hypothetical protein HC939_24010 [Pleurocapsa sp. SU_5_0]|nr:hypothetical protein [Pleurocapsa sp. SU_5_0]NJO96063.1 hypothetical protein [Pleurocapsa sp. CRU_1_2]
MNLSRNSKSDRSSLHGTRSLYTNQIPVREDPNRETMINNILCCVVKNCTVVSSQPVQNRLDCVGGAE